MDRPYKIISNGNFVRAIFDFCTTEITSKDFIRRSIRKFSTQTNTMKPGIYKHSKTGNLYKVHFVAKHSETLEDLVVYEALYDNTKSKFWVRPLSLFEGLITKDNKQVPRFEFISEK